jgi:hypothetical protein
MVSPLTIQKKMIPIRSLETELRGAQSGLSGLPTPIIKKSLFNQDINNVTVILVQHPHHVGNRQPMIHEEITYRQFTFRHWIR